MVVNFYTITTFINFLTGAVLAVLVILKNRRGQKNIAFFVLSGLISLWSLSYFFWQNVTDNPADALFWCRILAAFIILIPPAALYFVLAITETLEEKKWLLVFVSAYFYIFEIANATPNFINKVEPIMNLKYWPVATPLFSVYVFSFITCISYASFLLFKKYKSSTGLMRLQIKYVALGMFVAFLAGSSNFLPWYKIAIIPVGNALVPAFVIFMAYSITRYNLLNIKILARNLIFYFGFAFLLYAVFNGLAIAYKIIFGDVLAPEAYLTGLFLAPFLAAILYGSGNSLSAYINKYIFPSIYTYQQAMKEASYNLSRHASLKDIADIIISTIKKTIQPMGIAVLIASDVEANSNKFEIIKNAGLSDANLLSVDPVLFSEYFRKNQGVLTRESLEQLIQNTEDRKKREFFHEIENQLHQYGIFICAALKNNDDLLGIIIADNKQYEDSYSREDFDLLETLSHDAQIAIENDLLYKKIEKENYYLREVVNVKKNRKKIIIKKKG